MGNNTLKVGNWSEEKLRQKLKENHQQEDDCNRELAVIDKQSRVLAIRKRKLIKNISSFMKYRNIIVNYLPKK